MRSFLPKVAQKTWGLPKGWVSKRVVFQKGGFGERALVAVFRSGGTCERTLVLVFVLGENPNVPSFRFSFRGNIRQNYPFGNHPFGKAATPEKSAKNYHIT